MSNKHVYEAIMEVTDEFGVNYRDKNTSNFEKSTLINGTINAIRGLCIGAMEQLKEDEGE